MGQTANRNQLQVWDCLTNDPWQQWMVSYDSATGAAFLKNVGSGKCMDNRGFATPTSTAPGIWDCMGSNNLKWHVAGGYWAPTASPSVHKDTDAYVFLAANGQGDVALDSASHYANGSKLSLASAIDKDVDHQVRLLPGTSPNTSMIKFVGGNGNKCLDVPVRQTAGYILVDVWDCNGSANQNWFIQNRTFNTGLRVSESIQRHMSR